MRKGEGADFVDDLVVSAIEAGVSAQEAQRAVRALCREWGGQNLYVPLSEKKRAGGAGIREVMAAATNEAVAQKVLDKLCAFYGGCQVYVPQEIGAFRKVIALEIYEAKNSGVKMNELARKYRLAFTSIYRLWKEGQREKFHASLPYLPFLEFQK